MGTKTQWITFILMLSCNIVMYLSNLPWYYQIMINMWPLISAYNMQTIIKRKYGIAE